jgi:hypothetical protein
VQRTGTPAHLHGPDRLFNPDTISSAAPDHGDDSDDGLGDGEVAS